MNLETRPSSYLGRESHNKSEATRKTFFSLFASTKLNFSIVSWDDEEFLITTRSNHDQAIMNRITIIQQTMRSRTPSHLVVLSKDFLGFIFEEEFHGSDVFAPLAQSIVHDVDLVSVQHSRLDPRH